MSSTEQDYTTQRTKNLFIPTWKDYFYAWWQFAKQEITTILVFIAVMVCMSIAAFLAYGSASDAALIRNLSDAPFKMHIAYLLMGLCAIILLAAMWLFTSIFLRNPSKYVHSLGNAHNVSVPSFSVLSFIRWLLLICVSFFIGFCILAVSHFLLYFTIGGILPKYPGSAGLQDPNSIGFLIEGILLAGVLALMLLPSLLTAPKAVMNDINSYALKGYKLKTFCLYFIISFSILLFATTNFFYFSIFNPVPIELFVPITSLATAVLCFCILSGMSIYPCTVYTAIRNANQNRKI